MKRRPTYPRVLWLFICLFSFSICAYPTIIYVDKDATLGSDNGSDWDNAYLSLQDGITNASAGDTIAIAAGTYTPHASVRTTYFTLKEGVVILGGFAGTETDFSQSELDNRDFETNTTILSGDLGGDDSNFTNMTENSYHVLYAECTSSSITSATIVDGITVSGGYADYFLDPDYDEIRGGGIFLMADLGFTCSPTFKNIVVEENVAQFGAGIYIVAQNTGSVASPSFENFIVRNNRTKRTDVTQAISGAGISISALATTCNPVFNNGEILRNIVVTETDPGAGGGITLSAATIGDSAICTPIFTNILFCGNESGTSGTAINIGTSNNSVRMQPYFINVTIAGGSSNAPIYHLKGNSALGAKHVPVYTNTLVYTTSSTSITNYPVPASSGPTPTWTHCNLRGTTVADLWQSKYGTDGGNNLDEDAIFFDTANCNVDLYDNSPEIGSGNGSDGDNIGYYQGPGLIYLDIKDTTDFNECAQDTSYLFRLGVRDEAADSATYTLSVGQGDLLLSNISDTIINDTLDILITVDSGWYGLDTIKVVLENLLDERDTTEFEFSLNKKPTLNQYDLGVFDTNDSTYSVILYLDTTITGETYSIDGVVTGNNYFDGLEAGYHYGLIEKSGCFSDTLDIELEEYINFIPLEIVTISDTSKISLCGGDTTVYFECKIVDDNLDQVEWMFNYYYQKIIPDENVIQTETDSSIVFEIQVPDTVGLYRVHVHAENIYFELANLYLDIDIIPAPVVDSVRIQDYGYQICAYPSVSTHQYYYISKIYVDTIDITQTLEACDLLPGEHTTIAYIDGCPSNTYTFTIPEENDTTGQGNSLITRDVNNISIYPQPVDNILHISGIESATEIELFDLSGKSVLRRINWKKEETIVLSALKPGYYTAVIKTNNLIITKRFIKR